MIRAKYSILIGVLSIVVISGCASVLRGPTAEVRVSSQSDSVRVLLNGRDHGETPLVLELNRKEYHHITFLMNGYRESSVQITPKFDFVTTILGNAISWNIIGVVLDLHTGAAYTLTPSDIVNNKDAFVELAKNNTKSGLKYDISIVLMTNTQWEKIASR